MRCMANIGLWHQVPKKLTTGIKCQLAKDSGACHGGKYHL